MHWAQVIGLSKIYFLVKAASGPKINFSEIGHVAFIKIIGRNCGIDYANKKCKKNILLIFYMFIKKMTISAPK